MNDISVWYPILDERSYAGNFKGPDMFTVHVCKIVSHCYRCDFLIFVLLLHENYLVSTQDVFCE